MEVIRYTGIHKLVIDAVNSGAEDGISDIKVILLTRAEMDEFMATNPFVGGVGKFYGDADIPALMHIETANDQETVIGFYLNGVKVSAPVK